MSIKQQGGIFGRNPTFNNVDVEGTLTVNGEPISDFGTMAQQDADSVNIDGGNIDGTTIGAATPAEADFTNVDAVDIDVRNQDSAAVVWAGEPDTSGLTTSTNTSFLYLSGIVGGTSEYGGINFFRAHNNSRKIGASITHMRPATSLDDSDLIFKTSTSNAHATEKTRLTHSGDWFVAKTSQDVNTDGIELRSTGVFVATADGESPIFANRRSSDGAIATFMQSGSPVGSIKCRSSGGNLEIDTIQSGIDFGGDGWLPMRNGSIVDNDLDIGSVSFRFDDIYATNGTIQTSDRNEKQDIAELSEAERRVAVAAKGLIRKFRWQSAVAEKGDNARIHFGIIAQDLQDAFTAEGLDAGDYAMFTSTTWWEHTVEVPAVEAVEAAEATYDEDGNELTPAISAVLPEPAYTLKEAYETAEEAPEGSVQKTRLGVRYPELLAFIIAAM